jgi:probable phosphoglycerate mutase
MEIILIRHGQPEWIREGLNVVDPPLTDRVTCKLASPRHSVAAVRRGDRVAPACARQTALLAALGREQVVEPFLEEIREPDWHGTPAELAAAAYAEERSRAAEDRWTGVSGGGEPPREFVERVRGGAAEYWAGRGMYRSKQTLPVWNIDKPLHRVVIVAHSGTNGVLLCQLLGLDPVPWEWDRFVTMHASITRLTSIELRDGHTFSLNRLSDVEHIPTESRSQ